MKFLERLLVFGLYLLCMNAAWAMDDVYGENWFLDGDLVVPEQVVFNPDSVHVRNSAEIENYGVFDSRIYLCNGCDLFVENSGDFKADIVRAENADVYQVVTGADDLYAIDVNTNYNLLVRDANNIVLRDVLAIGMAADKIIIQDSVVLLNGINVRREYALELNGDVSFYVDNLDGLYGVPLLQNVSGGADVKFVTKDANPLFANVGYIVDEKLYVRQVRETDYVKVLGNNRTGQFINSLRYNNPGDGLIMRLDMAKTTDEVASVMTKSVRLNENALLVPIRAIHEITNTSYDFVSGLDIGTFGIVSGDFYTYGVQANMGFDITDYTDMQIAVRFGQIDYASSLDMFTGRFYGADVSGMLDLVPEYFVRYGVQWSHFQLDIGDVLYDSHVISNPSVDAVGGVLDIGKRYFVGDSFDVSLFMGADVDSYILDGGIYDTDLDIRFGANIGYEYECMGLRYRYFGNVIWDSNNNIVLGGRVGFWSVYDMAGADIGLDMLRMPDVTAYKIFISGKVSF